MAATYDSALPTSRDKVRFLVQDTAATFQLQDEEIDWILTEQSNVYLAAARALSTMAGKWAATGKGLTAKQVEDLRHAWGFGSGVENVVQERIAELRQLGTPAPRLFRLVGT